MPTVMNDRMISGIMNDRKVENSEVKVASRRMIVTKNTRCHDAEPLSAHTDEDTGDDADNQSN